MRNGLDVEPALPDGFNYSLMTYLAGMGFRARVLRDGREAAIAWLAPLANGHKSAVLKRLAPFLPSVVKA